MPKIKNILKKNEHQKEWEICLIWLVPAEMDEWQDITALSWLQLVLESKYKKAMLAHLKATKICDLVYRQRLQHCHEELCILEREVECRWMVAAI